MKLIIYSVSERRPPINENLLLWSMNDKVIYDVDIVQANIAIPDNAEEEESIPIGTVKDLIWSRGEDMCFDDLWSFVEVKYGD